MNELLELYTENYRTTREEVSAAILVLADVMQNKRVELDQSTVDVLIGAFQSLKKD